MKLFTLLIALVFSLNVFAQERYNFNGKSLELKTEVEGKLDLLIFNNETGNRYFVKDEDEIIHELINTKDHNGIYKQEYLNVLRKLINNPEISFNDIGFGRYSLKHFIRAYNLGDENLYAYTESKALTQIRLGFFGGITNHPFTINTENAISPFFNIELEVLGKNTMPRHSGYFNIFYVFENSDFKYSITQLSLGYRYRFINKPNFNIYGNLTFATYSFVSSTIAVENAPDQDISDSSFDAPFIFGIGADIKLKNNNHLSILYNSLFAALLDNEGNFPINLAIGYKFNL